MTLRVRLTLALLVVALVPMLLLVAAVAYVLSTNAVTRQERELQHRTELTAGRVSGYCDRSRRVAETAARAGVEQAPPSLQEALQALVDHDLADGVQVLDATGREVATAGESPPQKLNCLTEPAGGPHGAFLTARVPRYTAAGPAGTAVAGVRMDRELLRSLAEDAGVADVALLDPRGEVLVATPGVTTDVLLASRAGAGRAGSRVLALVGAGPGQPFGVLLVAPVDARPPVGWLVGWLVLGAVALAAGLAGLIARASIRPLVALEVAAARLAGGWPGAHILVRSGDEVGRLAGTLNAMAADLRAHGDALQSSRVDLQAGLDRLGDTLAVTHDLDRLLGVVLKTAMSSTRAGAGLVLLLGSGEDELVLAAARGLDERDAVPGLRLPLGVGVAGTVAGLGEPLLGRVGTGPGQLQPGPREPRGSELISVPLKSSGRVLGVLQLYDRGDRTGFDDTDLTTLRTFASQAAVAIDNVLLHEEAQRLSRTDGLTGLWNHRYLKSRLVVEVDRSVRFARPVAVLMLDLDNFKDVNDRHGHQRGDEVLVELAARVQRELRDVDVTSRYGGEELVLILPETDEAGAGLAAARLCEAVRSHPFGTPGELPVRMTVSIGIAVCPAHTTTAEGLLGRADEAMYAAKHAGRDGWRLASG